METLLILLAIAAIVFYWSDSMRTRELLLRKCRHECRQINAQLLDETVIIERQWLTRTLKGSVCIGRAYSFEFSLNGADRYNGTAVIIGKRIEYLRLDLPSGGALYDTSDNVVNLH